MTYFLSCDNIDSINQNLKGAQAMSKTQIFKRQIISDYQSLRYSGHRCFVAEIKNTHKKYLESGGKLSIEKITKHEGSIFK